VPKTNLTDPLIRALRPPPAGTITHWDGALKSFGIRVSQGGAKTFVVLIASGRRQSIGRYPIVTLAEARAQARTLLAEKTLGKVRPTHTAFDDAKAEYLAECEKENRPSTVYECKRLLATHYPFGRSSIASIGSRDILRRLSKLADRPSERQAAFRAGRGFFRWCVRQRFLDRSPLENVPVPPVSPSRDRVLSDQELTAIYRTAVEGATTYHRIVALLVLTGQRKSEISHLQWSWIDKAAFTITLPAGITKNKRTHLFPFGDAVEAVLGTTPRFDQNPFVFPAARERKSGKPSTVFNGWTRPKAAFDAELKAKGYAVAPWHLHDLRRTLSTGMAALQVQQTIVERILNHVSGGTLSPIAQVYNRYNYMGEMRDAVQRWQDFLQTLLSNKESITNGRDLRDIRSQRARAAE
jgi:integrase